ncbi:ester cyclase [Conexibacter sp. SYSU D00693]|uniref:ester cyclase n=1 Tax=Conexibacter sp. SYSU D00693 TaxID=2812560 RepID=UPI00196BA586|nr:ester cyclase [Conexibacter sp. SYSU D00693]
MSQTRDVARQYFEAIGRRDVDAAVALWEPGGREHVHGQVDTTAPDGVREFLQGMLDALPDAELEVLSLTAERNRAAVHWTARGTFAGGELNGIGPTGAKIVLEGVDVLVVKDGRIHSNDAFLDGMGLARQVGLLPAQGSKQEARLARAFNLRTRVAAAFHAAPVEQIAQDVWIVRGGFPSRTMNVYLVRDGDGVMLFDAGIKQMTHAVAAAAASLGGVTKVLLGHAHHDHRGVAPALGADVWCHSAEREHAEGDGGWADDYDFSKLKAVGRQVYPRLLPFWDGGPVQVARTVEEGDEPAEGWKVVHLPGHAPGLIGIVRERDGLALVSDCIYTIDPETSIKGPPRVPHPAFTPDREAARASVHKLAELGPSIVWAGHAEPVSEDVRGQLITAAETT